MQCLLCQCCWLTVPKSCLVHSVDFVAKLITYQCKVNYCLTLFGAPDSKSDLVQVCWKGVAMWS